MLTYNEFNRQFARKLATIDATPEQISKKLASISEEIGLNHKEKQFPSHIDPFNVMAYCNRDIKEKREKAVNAIADWLGIDHISPHDKPYIPTANNNRLGFVDTNQEGYESCVDGVWEAFRSFVDYADGKSNRETFIRYFDYCHRLKGMARNPPSQLTMGLFWIDCDVYLSLNYYVQSHLINYFGIDKTRFASVSGESYLRLLDDVQAQFSEKNGVLSFSDLCCKSYKNPEYAKDYNPGITKEQWSELLLDKKVFNENSLMLMRYMMELGGEASCSQLAETYGGRLDTYRNISSHLGKRIHDATGCKLSTNSNNEERFWSIMFFGRDARADEAGQFVWIIRKELSDALKEIGIMDVSGMSAGRGMPECGYGLNTIFYGPPGTGKTYRAIRAAVEIIDGLSEDDFDHVKKRYDALCEEGRISFVTFHQSYGYEEFIEGIRPVMDSDDDSRDIRYDVVDGTFKRFCNRSSASAVKDPDIRDDPEIWKVSLEGTGDNDTREDCLKNGYIRIGYDSYGPEINDNIEFDKGGKTVLNQFIFNMQIGDLVLSCYSSRTIDAIGVVIGDYEWHDEFSAYKRVRKVKWIRKFSKEEMPDITSINNGKQLTLATIYRLRIQLKDVMELVGNIRPEGVKKNFVFIIDEINRGNISRIFGELITLIEPSKRVGATESMEALLPYSGHRFSIPSNVYIIGTMNTADRSLVSMDAALRRRFDFIEMMPDPTIIDRKPEGVDLKLLLETMNRRIETLYDREHTIGHSYFMHVESIADLGHVFRFNVIPLLMDYFHGDYEKIKLVLSTMADCNKSPFIVENDPSESFGNYSGGDVVTYSIDDQKLDNPESYISLYHKQS